MKKLLLAIFLLTGLYAEPILKFYCGATMAQTMKELASKFEKDHNVKIIIIKGGSSKLYKQILANKDADLFLPGAPSYIKNDKNNIFTYKKRIGYNRAVILVQKNNPKLIRDLNDFTNSNIKVVLGNEKSGSVGKITKKILIKYKGKEFFEKVYNKAQKVPTSLEIVQAVATNQADASINWKAAAMGQYKDKLAFVPIPYIAPKQTLILAVTKYSKYPDIAKEFVDFVFQNKAYLKSKGF